MAATARGMDQPSLTDSDRMRTRLLLSLTAQACIDLDSKQLLDYIALSGNEPSALDADLPSNDEPPADDMPALSSGSDDEDDPPALVPDAEDAKAWGDPGFSAPAGPGSSRHVGTPQPGLGALRSYHDQNHRGVLSSVSAGRASRSPT